MMALDEIGAPDTATRINLLPWRDRARARRGKATVAGLLAAMALGIALVAMVGLWLERRIDARENQNRLLEQELATLGQRLAGARDLREQAERAAAHVALIRELRQLGLGTVRVLDALAQTLVEGIHYRRIERRGAMLDIAGIAESNAQIAGLMRNFDDSAWLASANLRRLREASERAADGPVGSAFEMTVLQLPPVIVGGDPGTEQAGSVQSVQNTPADGAGTTQQTPLAGAAERAF